MSKIRIAINGMGRIGQCLCRVIMLDLQDHFEIVGMNDIVPVDVIAKSLRRDSAHGKFPVNVDYDVNASEIYMGEYTIKVLSERDASNAPWKELSVDIVFECSGFYLKRELSEAHLKAGAKKVVMSAPPKDDTPIFVIGVNDEELEPGLSIVSNASCTTNCLAPMVKALDASFGVVSGLMSTTHAATNTQSILDGFGGAKNRATLNNIIPTSTGAARAIGRVMPSLDGLLNGSSLRVPTDDVSVVEAVFVINGSVDASIVLAELEKQAEKQNARSILNSVLYVGNEYEVSADARGSAYSSMVLSNNIMVIPFGNYTLVKLTSFYDNEIGYSYRMCDLAIKVNNL